MAGENAHKPFFRSEPSFLTISEVESMIRKKDFYDEILNSQAKGFDNLFQARAVNGDKIVLDFASGLVWQQSGSSKNMNYEKANKWIEKLNKKGYAGFHDWRAPTLEEAMSLMESKKRSRNLHIDPAFDKRQQWIWTADRVAGVRLKLAWVVDFAGGCYGNVIDDSLYYVRAVRVGQ